MMDNRLNYHQISTESGQVGYVKLGAGHPLIMLVGYSGNLLHWNSEFIYALAQKFTLYLPDNRLVGLSNSSNPEDMDGLAQDVIDFIIALDLSQPLICGWSMGGIIAQAVVNQQPQLIAGMALIVSQPDYSYTFGELHHLVRNLRDYPSRESREKLTELFFSTTPTIEFRKYLAKTILPIEHYVYPFNAQAQALQDLAVTKWQADLTKLAQYSAPVLITTAKNDLVTKPQASWILHQSLPNSKLVSYPDGGHFFMHHYPQSLANEIIRYFVA